MLLFSDLCNQRNLQPSFFFFFFFAAHNSVPCSAVRKLRHRKMPGDLAYITWHLTQQALGAHHLQKAGGDPAGQTSHFQSWPLPWPPFEHLNPPNLNRVTECTPFSHGFIEGQALIITSKVHDPTEYSEASVLCTYLVAASWKISFSLPCECCTLEAKFTYVCRTSGSKRCFFIVCWQSCRL